MNRQELLFSIAEGIHLSWDPVKNFGAMVWDPGSSVMADFPILLNTKQEFLDIIRDCCYGEDESVDNKLLVDFLQKRFLKQESNIEWQDFIKELS